MTGHAVPEVNPLFIDVMRWIANWQPQFMQFKSVALLLARGAREDQVAKDGTTLDKLMADVPPNMLKNLPPDVDAFVKRHQPR